MQNRTRLILIFSLLFTMLTLFNVKAQTYVSGFINANTTWNVANSPYIVNGNALLSQGYTLTIESGVTIKFYPGTALQIDGQLIAIGTAQNRIIFTSSQSSPQVGDWAKLHISDKAIDAVYDSNGNYVSGTIMKYCDVLYGGGIGYGQVHIESASPYFSHCRIEHSKASGIYCVGSSYVLDSSKVNNCSDYGLYFGHVCPLTLCSDTIENNQRGGILASSMGCNTIIKNNYFNSNHGDGAICAYSISNATITQNYFWNNSSTTQERGTIAFYYSANNLTISNNYFIDNHTFGDNSGIFMTSNPSSVKISENYFANNSTQNNSAIVCFRNGGNPDTISCNVFLNNQTTGTRGGVIYLGFASFSFSGLIYSNIFDGNINNSIGGYSIINMENQGNAVVDFSNNIIRNNLSPSGTCCRFNAHLTNTSQLLKIHDNEFKNNTAQNVIYLDGGQVHNSSYDFLYMKYNHFFDKGTNQLYNHIPYGSPNVNASDNYWGTTNSQQIDSVIFDYFDNANYSVVYYNPILPTSNLIDTNCNYLTGTAIIQHSIITSYAFPNPFSTCTKIVFGREIIDGSLILYNMFGQRLKQIEQISGDEVLIQKDDLPCGIYIYEVIEKKQRIGYGKVVAE